MSVPITQLLRPVSEAETFEEALSLLRDRHVLALSHATNEEEAQPARIAIAEIDVALSVYGEEWRIAAREIEQIFLAMRRRVAERLRARGLDAHAHVAETDDYSVLEF